MGSEIQKAQCMPEDHWCTCLKKRNTSQAWKQERYSPNEVARPALALKTLHVFAKGNIPGSRSIVRWSRWVKRWPAWDCLSQHWRKTLLLRMNELDTTKLYCPLSSFVWNTVERAIEKRPHLKSASVWIPIHPFSYSIPNSYFWDVQFHNIKVEVMSASGVF